MKLGWRLVAIGALTAGFFAVLLLRLWFLQVNDVTTSLDVAYEQRVRVVEVEAPRGDIFDNSGKELLAGTVATLRVVVDRKLVDDTAEEFPGAKSVGASRDSGF